MEHVVSFSMENTFFWLRVWSVRNADLTWTYLSGKIPFKLKGLRIEGPRVRLKTGSKTSGNHPSGGRLFKNMTQIHVWSILAYPWKKHLVKNSGPQKNCP